MPGANCSIVHCATSRRTKGIGIFRLPSEKSAAGANDEAHQKWRDLFLGAILSGREKDASFTEQIKKGNVFVCEKHFNENDFDVCK